MKTYSPSADSITRKWVLFDAKGQILGRLATQIARALMGKDKTSFVRHLDIGDHVVVINAAQVVVTGRKDEQKVYHQHSGYPGGMKVTSYENMLQSHPERIIIRAVSGMIPQNKLHDKMLKHLHVFPGESHTYGTQFKKD